MKQHACWTQKRLLALSLVSILSTGGSAYADEREDLEVVRQTTINLIFALVEKGVLTHDAAQALVKQAEDTARKKVEASRGSSEKIVRVPYVPETVKREIREQVKQEVVAQAKAERWGDVNAIPEWLDRLKWEGDIRVRYQGDRFSDTNPSPVVFALAGQNNVTNSTENSNRARLRARLGLLAKITSDVSAGFRLTTGNTSDPVSTNQTLGNYENKYSLVFDRAYLKLDPWESVTVSAGRIPNPFYSTDLVWDEDLNFEGAAASWRTPESSISSFRPFVTLGAFALQQIEQSDTVRAKDKWFWGAQAGFEWRSSHQTRVKLGLSYYDYREVNGIPNPNNAANPGPFDRTAPTFRQKGNTVFDINANNANDSILALAPDFNLVNLTGSIDLAHFDPVHVILTGDYVRNVGYKQDEIAARTGLTDTAPKVTGWQGRLAVGMPVIRDLHDWQIFGGYRYLQRDAVLDAFTDSDFHLGGTDTKGYFIGGSYGLNKNTWVSLRWLSADQINGLPLAIDVLQLDLNAKF